MINERKEVILHDGKNDVVKTFKFLGLDVEAESLVLLTSEMQLYKNTVAKWTLVDAGRGGVLRVWVKRPGEARPRVTITSPRFGD